MVVVWIVLGLAVWTAVSVAAGVVIGRMIAAGDARRAVAEDAAADHRRGHAEAA